jgi:hypothetical protein
LSLLNHGDVVGAVTDGQSRSVDALLHQTDHEGLLERGHTAADNDLALHRQSEEARRHIGEGSLGGHKPRQRLAVDYKSILCRRSDKALAVLCDVECEDAANSVMVRTSWASGLIFVVIDVVAFMTVDEFLASLLDGLALLALALKAVLYNVWRMEEGGALEQPEERGWMASSPVPVSYQSRCRGESPCEPCRLRLLMMMCERL